MKGAMRIVAIRSRRFSIVRVARTAGTAQAYAERSGRNDFPWRPAFAIVRSAISAARARYPSPPGFRGRRRGGGSAAGRRRPSRRLPRRLRRGDPEKGRREIRGEPGPGRETPCRRGHQRAGESEDRSEDGHHDDDEDRRAPDGVEEDGVRAGASKSGAPALRSPPSRPGPRPLPACRTSWRTGRSSEAGTPSAPSRNSRTGVSPSPRAALVRATGAPSCFASAAGIQVAAAALQLVGHVQDDERRKPEPEDPCRKDEVPASSSRRGSGGWRPPRRPRHLPHQDVVRHPLVLRAREKP